MHLAPLAGIETIQEVLGRGHHRCISHPLRGLKLDSSWTYLRYSEWMHLAPLAGIETLVFQNERVEAKMHLAPLAGIETVDPL